MQYIVYLLQNAHIKISALDLEKRVKLSENFGNPRLIDEEGLNLTETERDLGTSLGDGIEDIKESTNIIKTELQRLEDEYEKENDPTSKADIRERIDKLQTYFERSKDIRKQPRILGEPLEKARKRISYTIKKSLEKIRQHSPALWRHLSNSIAMGRYCSYNPETDISWVFINC